MCLGACAGGGDGKGVVLAMLQPAVHPVTYASPPTPPTLRRQPRLSGASTLALSCATLPAAPTAQHDEAVRAIGERGRLYAMTYMTDGVVLAYRMAVLQQLKASVPLQLSRHARHGPGMQVCCEDILAESFHKFGSPGGDGHHKNQVEYYGQQCNKTAPLMAGPACMRGRAPSAPNPLVYAAGALCK